MGHEGIMRLKRWALGTVHSELHRVLSEPGAIDPRRVPSLIFKTLSLQRPNAFNQLAGLAYAGRAYASYRARRALSIARHYDLPTAFYRLFLDRDYAAYSCAIFDDPAWTLERAQRRKFDILAAKLEAKSGHRILDIGCGWGSFLKYAGELGLEAEGIALSAEQIAECRRLGLRASYADAAEAMPAPVDRIITIGMMEHAKDRRAAILDRCFRALVPGGRMVIQEMCSGSQPVHPAAAVFVAEEIFVGDWLGTYTSIQRDARRAGFDVVHLECFGRHYRTTALEWSRRHAERFEEAQRLVGYRTAMSHLLCQAGFAWYFGTGALDLVQYVLVKPDGATEAGSGTAAAGGTR
jgi:cyclopropane-fatty-acyl-phospholipid synthase